MKKKFLTYLSFIGIAILASTLFITWSSLSDVSACVQSPGCIDQNNQPTGKLTTRNYGFPSTYKQVVSFAPNNNDSSMADYAGYTEAKAVTKSTSIINIFINIIFWFGLLYAIYSLFTRLSRSPKHTSTQSKDAQSD